MLASYDINLFEAATEDKKWLEGLVALQAPLGMLAVCINSCRCICARICARIHTQECGGHNSVEVTTV